MKIRIDGHWLLILFAILIMAGCSNNEEKKTVNQTPAAGTNQMQPFAVATSLPPEPVILPSQDEDVAVNVDGNVLKKSVLEKAVKEKLKAFKGKIPAAKMKEAQARIKKQMIDELIVSNLLTNEVEKRKITATDKEIKATMDQIKSTLQPDEKLETFMKENNISKEHIALGIKVSKLVKQEAGNKAKPTQKEISKFYEENKDKFIIPEGVHVRHILIAFAEGDDEKVKAEKKAKIEGLRNQIVGGADFAELARKNSDCPSKDNGGDLGVIRKGQTVKPFEDAAFSQKINVVGPVVATEYGYHVIQVLGMNQQKTAPLEEVKEKISKYLEQQKQASVFNALLKKLRDKAKITVYEK
ncbi:MAG: peptidylprolyl isomerase [Smithella sp.]